MSEDMLLILRVLKRHRGLNAFSQQQYFSQAWLEDLLMAFTTSFRPNLIGTNINP